MTTTSITAKPASADRVEELKERGNEKGKRRKEQQEEEEEEEEKEEGRETRRKKKRVEEKKIPDVILVSSTSIIKPKQPQQQEQQEQQQQQQQQQQVMMIKPRTAKKWRWLEPMLQRLVGAVKEHMADLTSNNNMRQGDAYEAIAKAVGEGCTSSIARTKWGNMVSKDELAKNKKENEWYKEVAELYRRDIKWRAGSSSSTSTSTEQSPAAAAAASLVAVADTMVQVASINNLTAKVELLESTVHKKLDQILAFIQSHQQPAPTSSLLLLQPPLERLHFLLLTLASF